MRKRAIQRLLLVVATALLVSGLTGCGSDEGDIDAPSLTLDSLQGQNANQTGTREFKIDGATELFLSGTVEAGALVEVEVGSNEPVAANVSGGAWDYTLNSASLEEGANRVVVSAEDSVGNKRSLSFFVTRDTTGPVITFEQYLTPDQDGSQTIGGTVAAGSTVEVFVDAESAAFADVEAGLWHHALNGLAAGTHDISVKGYDEIGNPSSAVSVQIEVDGTAPLLSVDPSSLAWTAASSSTLSGTRESGIAPDFTPIETAATIENVDITSDPTIWSANFVDLEAGVNLLSIVIDDGLGSAAEAQVMVYRDLTAPSVLGNSPAHGSEGAPPGEVTVAFSEDMDATSIEVTDVATAESPPMTVVDSAGELVDGDITYDAGSRTAIYTPNPLVPGQTYTVTVDSAVTDALGNQLGDDYVWTFKTN